MSHRSHPPRSGIPGWVAARWFPLLMGPLCLGALWLRRAALLFSRGEVAPHFEWFLVPALSRIDRGEWWVPGPELADTGLYPGGPLYYWFNLPPRLIQDPMLALQLYYFALEGAGLLCFVALCRRVGVRRAVAWGGALFLLWTADPKLMVCENMTFAIFAAAPLFATALWAGSGGRPWRALLPGALAGLGAGMHIFALALAPAVLCGWWAEPRREGVRRRPRAALFVLACAVVLGGANLWPLFCEHPPPGSPGGGGGLGAFVARLWQLFDAGRIPGILAETLPNPLALAGLALGLWRWWRGRPGGPGERLALCWLAWVAVPVTLAVALREPGINEIRLALWSPALALLTGSAVAWAVDRGRALLGERGRRPVLLPVGLAVAALGVALWSAAELRGLEADSPGAGAGDDGAACAIRPWTAAEQPLGFAAITKQMLRAGLPEPRRALALLGPDTRRITAALYWMQTSGLRWLRAPLDATKPRTALLAPVAPQEQGLLPVPDAAPLGPWQLLPGTVRLHDGPFGVIVPEARRPRLEVPRGIDGPALVAAFALGMNHKVAGLTLDGRPLQALRRCQQLTKRGFDHFFLADATRRPGESGTLAIQGAEAEPPSGHLVLVWLPGTQRPKPETKP